MIPIFHVHIEYKHPDRSLIFFIPNRWHICSKMVSLEQCCHLWNLFIPFWHQVINSQWTYIIYNNHSRHSACCFVGNVCIENTTHKKPFKMLFLLMFNYKSSVEKTSHSLLFFNMHQNENCKQSNSLLTRAFLNWDRNIFLRA